MDSEPEVIKSPWSFCFDCEKYKGTKPVVLSLEKEVKKVCRRCWEKNWAIALHPESCDCGCTSAFGQVS